MEQGLEAIRVEHLCKSDGADDADKMSSFHAYAQTLATRTKVAGALVSKKSLAEAKESLLNTEGLPVNHLGILLCPSRSCLTSLKRCRRALLIDN